MQDMGGHGADRIAVAVLEQAVELAAVALELGSLVEDLAEGFLNDRDVLADTEPAAEFALDVGRRREVVGMDVGLDQPFEPPAVAPDMVDDAVGAVVCDAARRVVDVHHRIDDRAGVGRGIAHDVADRVGRCVEERHDLGLDAQVGCEGQGLTHWRFSVGSSV